MRKAALSVIGFLALAAVIGFVVTSGGRLADRTSSGGGGVKEEARTASGPTTLAPEDAFGGLAVPAVSDQSAAAGAVGTTAIGALPPIGLDVVKTARLSIEVGKDEFGRAFDAATLVAGRYGGYVESSAMAGTKSQSGDLVIRVPATSFDDAIKDLRELGTVERQSIEGRVVTAEFIDLQARLRTWEAQEGVLLGLMKGATSVDATLRVQRELQDVQFRIEQIKGQLRVLEDQTALATIQVSMHETGAPVAVEQTTVGERPSLFEAWERALNGFLGVVYATVVGLGYLVPVTALVLLAWLGYRRVRPRVAASA
jgi:hypothetical protein